MINKNEFSCGMRKFVFFIDFLQYLTSDILKIKLSDIKKNVPLWYGMEKIQLSF